MSQNEMMANAVKDIKQTIMRLNKFMKDWTGYAGVRGTFDDFPTKEDLMILKVFMERINAGINFLEVEVNNKK